MNFPAVPKAHFNLGRVDVHIDAGRVQLDIQRIHRLAVAVQHIFIGTAHCVGEHLVAHISAIDIGKLLVGAGAGGIRHTRAAPHAHGRQAVAAPRSALMQHGHRLHDKVAAQHISEPFVVCGLQRIARAGAPLLDQLALVPDSKTYIGPHQRVAAHGVNAVGQLGGVGFQKLAARWRGIKQLTHFNAGAPCAGGGLQLARAAIELPGMVCALRS